MHIVVIAWLFVIGVMSLALSSTLAAQGAGPQEDAQKWRAQVGETEAAIAQAQAEAQVAQLRYSSQIDGVNTHVAEVEAELAQARFYLDNKLMVAPEDGYIITESFLSGCFARSRTTS